MRLSFSYLRRRSRVLLVLGAVLTVCVAQAGGARTASAASAPAAHVDIPAVAVGIFSEDPTVPIKSRTKPPAGFLTTLDQALAAAKRYKPLDAFHRTHHPLQYTVVAELGGTWAITFFYRGETTPVAQVVVNGQNAKVIALYTGPLAYVSYARGDFYTGFGRLWVLLPASLLFLLVFFDPRRLLSWALLDAVVVLSFLLSYLFFDHAHLIPGVWLAYPPLAYLLVRMLWRGGLRLERWRVRWANERPVSSRRIAPLLPTPVLAGGLILMIVARALLCIHTFGIEDAGYAAVAGADRIVHGLPIYYQSGSHYDTYGPLLYLAYVPFELLFPFNGSWADKTTADAATIFFDVATIAALVALGRTWRPGREGWRLGLTFGWAFAACPFTLLTMMTKTNDGLIALLVVLSLLALNSSIGSGVMVAIAAAAKFTPAGLIGLFAWPRRRGRRDAIVCGVVFVLVIVTSVLAFTPPGGLSVMWNHTIGWQLTRSDVFSPWALHPGLKPVQDLVELGIAVLCLGLFFTPPDRSKAQMAALSAAVMIAVQLPELHWFYFYIDWFLPPLVVCLLSGNLRSSDSPMIPDAVPAPQSLVGATST